MNAETRAFWAQITAGALLMICVGILAFNINWVVDALGKPRAVPLAEVDRARKPADLPSFHVRVSADSAIDLKLARATKQAGRTNPSSKFIALKTGENYMLAEVPLKHSGAVVAGRVTSWGGAIQSEAREKAEADHPELRGKLLPIGVSAQNWAGTEAVALLVACALLGGIALYLLFFTPCPPEDDQKARLLTAAESTQI